MTKLHDHLTTIVKDLPSDLDDTGELPDCSCGCAYWIELVGEVGMDFGICVNPKSPRVGLLTWEHQGCPKFEEDEGLDEPEETWTEPYIPKMWREG